MASGSDPKMNRKPRCIIVTGRAGAGKTTLAKKLGKWLWMPVISRDEIKEGYVNTFGVKHDELPNDTDLIVTNFFFEIVDQYLANKISIIIEAAFQHKVWGPRIARITENADPFLVICSIDAEIAARRHLQRGLDEPKRTYYHDDKRVAVYLTTGEMGTPKPYEAPVLNVRTIHVSTDGEYLPTIEEIVEKVRN